MKIAFRSPKLFSHGGLFLHAMGRWYRVFKVGER